ncbi:hypothetical protein NVP1293O_59 [Vibrio phage 1.293.O._10N.261.52.E1]|nr:hypothetical protein NVP1293O_59 [Vibrio phage 1.293.O._10N.261.52.E1]
MYELMNNQDLNMYYGGTYMQHGERIVYVERVQGERSSSVAETLEGTVPMEELSAFFPSTQVLQQESPDPAIITQASGRNYKKSYRSGFGSRRQMCNAFTATLTARLPSLQEASEILKELEDAHRVFGTNGKFYLRKHREYSVPLIYHLHSFLGYYDVEENKVIVAEDTNQIMIERLVKNCGGADVIVES